MNSLKQSNLRGFALLAINFFVSLAIWKCHVRFESHHTSRWHCAIRATKAVAVSGLFSGAPQEHHGDNRTAKCSKSLDFLPRSFCGAFFERTSYILSAPQRCNAERSDAQRNFFTSQFRPLFLQRHRCDALPCFSASPVIISYIAHISFPPFASNFPFATMVYCTKQQEVYQESQRSDVATGNAGWPSQTQTQTQRCGALRLHPCRAFLGPS